MENEIIQRRQESLDGILQNKEITIEEKAKEVAVWGNKWGLNDTQEKIEKAINERRLWYVSKDKVRYISKEGEEKEYKLKQFVRVAIKVGDWRDQMKLLGIKGEDILDILVKMYDKYHTKRTITVEAIK